MNQSSIIHPAVCVRCAAKGRTCCMVTPGDEEFCFPISASEMAAIRGAGQGGGESFVLAPNTPGFVEQLCLLMPDRDVEAAFPARGSHWRLAVTPEGRCVFLGEGGCILDRAVRPLYCRLFPLWSFDGRLTWFTAEECLANAECPSLGGMLKAMGTDADEVMALFASMCAKLGLDDK
jgi:Fe-S-cluster containining protein